MPRHLAFEPAFYRFVLPRDNPVAETVAFFSRGTRDELVAAVLRTVPEPGRTGAAPINLRSQYTLRALFFGVAGEATARLRLVDAMREAWWDRPSRRNPENPPRTDERYVDDGHQWYLYHLLTVGPVVVPEWADWVSLHLRPTEAERVSIRRVPGPNPVPLPDWLPEWAHNDPARNPDRVNPEGTRPRDGDVHPDDPAWEDE